MKHFTKTEQGYIKECTHPEVESFKQLGTMGMEGDVGFKIEITFKDGEVYGICGDDVDWVSCYADQYIHTRKLIPKI